VTFPPMGASSPGALSQAQYGLLDVETGTDPALCRDYPADYMAVVDRVAISPDGRRLLTGSNEGRARLWDVGREKDLQRFAASDDRTNSIG